MKLIAADSNNDLLIDGSGKLVILNGKEAIAQLIVHYIRAIKGEMFTKKDKGMPYFEDVFNKSPSNVLFETAFRKRVKEIDGVSIETFRISVTDTVNYEATFRTKFGGIELNGSV